MSVIVPGTVTSWPWPIDRTTSLAGRCTDWAYAAVVGATASGAKAQAAVSMDWIKRRFMVLPLEVAMIALVVCSLMLLVPHRDDRGVLAAGDADRRTRGSGGAAVAGRGCDHR